ncbi:MAG: glycosyltransferase family 2 protein [Clostridiales bacterium]|nr:glycosyltransferase family 2 protein [Clostridiales bacterium]
MEFLKIWLYIDIAVFGLYVALNLHKVFYTVVALFYKPKFPDAKKNHKFCAVIPARNEEKVIADLVDSIRKQDYPADLIDVFVVADNCSDRTADVARDAGATVFERFDLKKRGKAYALDYALKRILADYAGRGYEAALFFDADNVLARAFVREMNKAYDCGAKICTCYRNSKNWGKNWLTGAYGIFFMSECRFMHNSRSAVRSSTFVSGTGFFVDFDLLKNEGGWRYELLTEDIEFSLVMALRNHRVDYNKDAVLYDEQPDKFSVSWKQRMRWAKGFYQCLKSYSGKLVRGFFKPAGFACYDLFTVLAPHAFLAAWVIASFIVRASVGLAAGASVLLYAVLPFAIVIAAFFVMMWAGAGAVILSERKNIDADFWQKLRAFALFPIFMLTYIPIGLAALFSPVIWSPIEHTESVKIEDLERKRKKRKKGEEPVEIES